MADYINKNILCQAYIHIDPVPEGLDEEALSAEIKKFLSARASFFLYEEVETDVELREGSLKIYATILGGLYFGISQYGSFRSGIDYLAADAKRVSEYAVSEGLFLTKSRHGSTIRTEARLGVSGSLKKIADDIDSIKRDNGNIDPSKLASRMEKLKHDILALKDHINDQSDKQYVFDNLYDYAKEVVPGTPAPMPRESLNPFVLNAYRTELQALLDALNTGRRKP